jgi:hypothetical protein
VHLIFILPSSHSDDEEKKILNHTYMKIFKREQMANQRLLHRKKKVREFPVPSQDVTTKLSLGGNNDVITELLLPRGSLVSDIPAGDGKLINLFLRCSEILQKKTRTLLTVLYYLIQYLRYAFYCIALEMEEINYLYL